MILYWNEGERRYGRNPIPAYRRVGWEFQLFLSGSCLLVKNDGAMEQVRPKTLLVFPPSAAHGWGGTPESVCDIRVVHFSRVREPLGELCLRKGTLKTQLTEGQTETLEEVFQATGTAYKERSILLDLHAERLLMELSLLVLTEEPALPKGGFLAGDERVVGAAVSYFRDYMHLGVSVEDVAVAVFVSPSHLRRLFHDVKGVSPRQLFQEERLERAKEMLKETTYTLDRIAGACGFETGGSLVRAFRSLLGETPSAFRERHKKRGSDSWMSGK